MKSISDSIQDTLVAAFSPTYLEVIDESAAHASQASSKNRESHFKIIIVSEMFEKQSLLKRHRQIHMLLTEVFKAGLHALSLHVFSVIEWKKKAGEVIKSPACQNKI